MKKLLIILGILSLSVVLAACGEKEGVKPETSGEGVVVVTPVDEVEESGEEEVVTPVEETSGEEEVTVESGEEA